MSDATIASQRWRSSHARGQAKDICPGGNTRGIRVRATAPPPILTLRRLGGETRRTFYLLSMFRSQHTHGSRWTARALRVGVALTFALGVTTLLVGFAPTNAGASAASFHYQAGYSLQSGWLCYGFSNGALHCTQRWHRDASGRLISDNPAWVPNVGGAPTGSPGGSPPAPTNSAGEPCRSGVYFNAATPTQWQVPPGCYSGVYRINPANYVYRPGFGWCNWWPEVMNPSRPNILWGPYQHGSTPRPGAVVRFAGGAQGASSAGHYGRVIAVHPGGYWFLISEMNFYWRGAGWQKVEYRYVHVGAGVSFIY